MRFMQPIGPGSARRSGCLNIFLKGNGIYRPAVQTSTPLLPLEDPQNSPVLFQTFLLPPHDGIPQTRDRQSTSPNLALHLFSQVQFYRNTTTPVHLYCLWMLSHFNGTAESFVTKILRPAKLNIFSIWPFAEKLASPCDRPQLLQCCAKQTRGWPGIAMRQGVSLSTFTTLITLIFTAPIHLCSFFQRAIPEL